MFDTIYIEPHFLRNVLKEFSSMIYIMPVIWLPGLWPVSLHRRIPSYNRKTLLVLYCESTFTCCCIFLLTPIPFNILPVEVCPYPVQCGQLRLHCGLKKASMFKCNNIAGHRVQPLSKLCCPSRRSKSYSIRPCRKECC